MNASASAGAILFAAVFAQNVVFTRQFVSGQFLRAAGRPKRGLAFVGCTGAATVVLAAAAWAVSRLWLRPAGLAAFVPLCTILLAAGLEAAAELALRRFAPRLRGALGGLPSAALFSTAALGIALLGADDRTADFFPTLLFALGSALGLLLAFLLSLAAAEKLRSADQPATFRGLPIALITAGIVSLAFTGFLSIPLPS